VRWCDSVAGCANSCGCVGNYIGGLISVLIGALGLGGCIVDRDEEHSSVLVQPMPVRHSYWLLNLIILAETGALDHLQTGTVYFHA